GVTRGSFLILKTGPLTSFKCWSSFIRFSASTPMVRNLYTLKCRLFRPSLFWTNETGPGDVTLMRIATTSRTGEIKVRTMEEIVKSKTRLANIGHPSIQLVEGMI